MEYQNILWEQQGGVGVITLNRPDALNALNRPHLAELNHAIERARLDTSGRSAVITGAGRGFSAGADINEWSNGGGEDDEPSAGWIDLAHALASAHLPPAEACHRRRQWRGRRRGLRVASTAARLGQDYIKLGYCPDAGGSFLLPRLIGEARAMER
ncbi:MAG TPA: enoyl-CoA hydratase/isomerase family protein [Thermomicrobiales bacterium]|nr:enoyl-CoA hydratase/isomerase family protein [Thermomicrobiales bacterium]